MKIAEVISRELGIEVWQTAAVLRLLEEGNTIPFIARYRKEAHGNLPDGVLRELKERADYLQKLEERKETILASLRDQGKLAEHLEKQIREAMTASALEDLYRPFKPKKKTRGMAAREKGLLPLARAILRQEEDFLDLAEKLRDPKKELPDTEAVLAGAKDIIAEELSDRPAVRRLVRNRLRAEGVLTVKGKDPEKQSVYEGYYDFRQKLRELPGHRVLAIDRGEKEGCLRVSLQGPEAEILRDLEKQVISHPERKGTAALLREAVEDGYRRLLEPSVENELRREATAAAQERAIRVFGENLRHLLMQQPLPGRVVLGWDPAFRTGCKLAVVDETGGLLDTRVIYPLAPRNERKEAKAVLRELVKAYGITLVSLGNGTASRESEQFLTEFIQESGLPLEYAIVSEAGASVYSAGVLAAREFPELDPGFRSAASIARRLQDPLAELVKIDPSAIGVGQYQHDLNEKRLQEVLGQVVEDCVNQVGVDLNTASSALLEHVAGIGQRLAERIVDYRREQGPFRRRQDLLSVEGLGPKTYRQCAGFLRIREGAEPLDGTGVHPESYGAARKLLSILGYSEGDLSRGGIPGISGKLTEGKEMEGLAEALSIGIYTLSDILSELERPGRDPRSEAPAPILRSDILSMEDLKPGLQLKGTVRNVVDFGIFVDIGVHQDGLVHISELSDRFVKDPAKLFQVGDVVSVRVLSADPARKRISLSMRNL